ncbi:MAG: hypothetical protein C3F10_13225 [Dehalococcoidia bacterium]|nr:MAG: hypothetical protein C3F10_13225 [Dehalococcoidia bacterium]
MICPGSGYWPFPEDRCEGAMFARCAKCDQVVALTKSRHLARHRLICPRCRGGSIFIEDDGLHCLHCGSVATPLSPKLEAELRAEQVRRQVRQRRKARV